MNENSASEASTSGKRFVSIMTHIDPISGEEIETGVFVSNHDEIKAPIVMQASDVHLDWLAMLDQER